MGTLSFKKDKFYFDAPSHSPEWKSASDLAFIWDEQSLQWTTRSHEKAVKLRRFADASADKKLNTYFITEYAPPEQLIYPDHLEPKVFQIESAWHCLTRSPAYCADEAGLGKTITSILCMNTVPGKTLIICPPYLKYNWFNEITKWSNSLWVEIIHSGADLLSKDADATIIPDSLLTNPKIQNILFQLRFEWLFIDETHRFKEATTKRTQALLGNETHDGIKDSAKRIVLLSGTPIPNGRPIELYPLLSQLAPHAIQHRSLQAFGKYFCGGKQVVRYEGGRPIAHWDYSSISNLLQLKRELRDKFMIRHLKKDVLPELGPKTRKLIFLDQPQELKCFEKKALKDKTLDELMGDDHALGDIATYRKEVGLAKITSAFHYISDLLEIPDIKLVVFAHHIEVVETLATLLEKFHPVVVRGGLTPKEKARRVNIFQTEKRCRLIIGNMDAMGTGLTLTQSSDMVIVEPSWTPATNEQAEDRIHRMTQNSNVYIRYLVMRNSLDERMLIQILNKQNAIAKVMN